MSHLSEPLPNPTPWESLAQQARWIAELAEQCAARPLNYVLPAGNHDPLTELDQRTMNLRAVVAAVRRDTYQKLIADGMTQAEIAATWEITPQAVNKVLNPR